MRTKKRARISIPSEVIFSPLESPLRFIVFSAMGYRRTLPCLGASRVLGRYRKKRENGAFKDNPENPFPSMGLEESQHEDNINEFDWEPDNIRGYPDKENKNLYWYIVKHKETGIIIEGFSQEAEYDSMSKIESEKCSYWISYTESGLIKAWMEEKDRNYIARKERKYGLVRPEDKSTYDYEASIYESEHPGKFYEYTGRYQPKISRSEIASNRYALFAHLQLAKPLPTLPPKDVLKMRAAYPYEAIESDELSFTTGDVLTVLNKQDNWWLCELHGKRGLAPSNYLEPFSMAMTPSTKQF